MANVEDTLVTKYILDDQYSSKAHKASQSTNTFGTAVKKAQANVGKKGKGGLVGAMSDFAAGANEVTMALKAAVMAITAVVAAGAGLIDLGMRAIEAFSGYDTVQRQFTGIFGSAKLAKQEMAYLNAEAQKGEFTFKDLADSASKITMTGLQFGKYKDAIQALAIRGGGGGEKLAEVTDILMRIQGGELGRAFMALKNLGVGPQEMAKLGATFSASGEFTGNVQQALSMFQKIGEASKKITGAMEGGSAAWLSNLKESFTRVFASIGDGLFDQFKKAGEGLADALNEAVDSGIIKDTIGAIMDLLDINPSDMALTHVIASVLAGVEAAAAYIKVLWEGIKAFVNSPIIQAILKVLGWVGFNNPIALMMGGMREDIGKVYENAYNRNLARLAQYEKNKKEPTEPDNPMASPMSAIASNTAQTASNTKQMLEMSRHMLGGGDLGRMGVTPVELYSMKHGAAKRSNTFRVEGAGVLENFIADQINRAVRQLKAQGEI